MTRFERAWPTLVIAGYSTIALATALVALSYDDTVWTSNADGQVPTGSLTRWHCDPAWKRIDGPHDGGYLPETQPVREPCALPMVRRRAIAGVLVVTATALIAAALRAVRGRLAFTVSLATGALAGAFVAFLSLPSDTPWSIAAASVLVIAGALAAWCGSSRRNRPPPLDDGA